ncbi:hypothetical protein G195_006318 [Phytophthora kernoviae 00238/432]|uniref:Uncharacterized protein n=2 Tax=Phytophthora kernoviae TaxID=325452 RepID=A0A8T0LWD6_9STRA|nr:hypothetical protein G195_006318 [Phytophthora kernoviae 00238/432]KAG2523239.1 hypothetical protein JM16_003870 [Phytophthora kernoviae]
MEPPGWLSRNDSARLAHTRHKHSVVFIVTLQYTHHALLEVLGGIRVICKRLVKILHQLAIAKLTPLRRWCIQLKLIVAQDQKTQRIGVTTGDDLETALQACDATLSRDQQCYDVVYREGDRVSDTRESLMDGSADGWPMDVQELLSFSTRSQGFVYRVTCLKSRNRVVFHCSEYVANLQEELERLLSDGSSVDAAITFICNAVKL